MLYFSLSTTAYASSNPESTFENYETTNYNFFEVNFDIPSNWRVVETDDRKTVYFYPEEGLFMFQYIDDISLETEESRKDFEVGLNQSGGKLDNEKILTYNDAYLYELEHASVVKSNATLLLLPSIIYVILCLTTMIRKNQVERIV